MKKISLLAVLFLFVITLSACSDLCVGTSCISGEDTEETNSIGLDNVINYPHINGHGVENTDQVAFVLFEEKMLGFVKYQVSYL